MSGIKGQPRADHRHAADQARQLPGHWVLAGTYGSRASAVSAALQVRTGDRLPAYRPAGAYAADVRLTQDGADLWIRYVDPAALQARDYRESIEGGLTEDLEAFSRRLEAARTSKDT
ncbi:hypothetical protein [Streptomyces bullii]|uniref:Uncharacterized protein n=1 Tax=Streptomyces bullii TaxID=349910 RepID=A0ABW0UQS9_9ACTN